MISLEGERVILGKVRIISIDFNSILISKSLQKRYSPSTSSITKYKDYGQESKANNKSIFAESLSNQLLHFWHFYAIQRIYCLCFFRFPVLHPKEIPRDYRFQTAPCSFSYKQLQFVRSSNGENGFNWSHKQPLAPWCSGWTRRLMTPRNFGKVNSGKPPQKSTSLAESSSSSPRRFLQKLESSMPHSKRLVTSRWIRYAPLSYFVAFSHSFNDVTFQKLLIEGFDIGFESSWQRWGMAWKSRGFDVHITTKIDQVITCWLRVECKGRLGDWTS